MELRAAQSSPCTSSSCACQQLDLMLSVLSMAANMLSMLRPRLCQAPGEALLPAKQGSSPHFRRPANSGPTDLGRQGPGASGWMADSLQEAGASASAKLLAGP